MCELRELGKLRRAIRGGREVPCREFRHQGPWLQDEPLEVPPGLEGGPDSLQTQERGAIKSPSLDGGLDISVSLNFFLWFVVSRREGVLHGGRTSPTLHSLAKVDSMHDRGKGALGG